MVAKCPRCGRTFVLHFGSPLPQESAKKLKKIMGDNRWTLSTAALEIGVSIATVNKAVNGGHLLTCTLTKLVKWLDKYGGVTVSETTAPNALLQRIRSITNRHFESILLQEYYCGNYELAESMLEAGSYKSALDVRKEAKGI
jgi:hypothetical protein